ncbi:MAG: hypothetical protein ACI9IV_000061 [Paracoccaceae bacterium]|jgi:hypothetical protein
MIEWNSHARGERNEAHMIRQMLKLLFFLLLLGFIGLVGFAYLGELSPQVKTISERVTLDAD